MSLMGISALVVSIQYYSTICVQYSTLLVRIFFALVTFVCFPIRFTSLSAWAQVATCRSLVRLFVPFVHQCLSTQRRRVEKKIALPCSKLMYANLIYYDQIIPTKVCMLQKTASRFLSLPPLRRNSLVSLLVFFAQWNNGECINGRTINLNWFMVKSDPFRYNLFSSLYIKQYEYSFANHRSYLDTTLNCYFIHFSLIIYSFLFY